MRCARHRAAGGAVGGIRADAVRCAGARARATQDVAYRTMRRLGSADWLIGSSARRRLPRCAVLAGAFALLLDPAFTVVDQAVTVIGARRECAFAKGMVNAVLRRFCASATRSSRRCRTMSSRAGTTARGGSRRCSARGRRMAGDPRGRRAAAADAAGERARASVDAYLETLRENGIDATAIGRHAVRLASALPVDRIPGLPTVSCRCRTPARSSQPNGSVRATACACSTCARPAARPVIFSNWPMRKSSRWKATRARHGSARTSCGCRSKRTCASATRVPRRVVRRAPVRPHPCRRAVLGVRHRASASRHSLAAPRGRHPGARRNSAASWRRCGRS